MPSWLEWIGRELLIHSYAGSNPVEGAKYLTIKIGGLIFETNEYIIASWKCGRAVDCVSLEN